MTNINSKIPLNPYSFDEEQALQDPVIIEKINNLLDFFNETGIRYTDFNIEPEQDLLKGLNRSDIVDKTAYPNIDPYMYMPDQHNMEKWIQAVKEIYHKEKNGSDRIISIKQSTSGWNITETYDFLNWLRYYEGNSHLKYKFAQLWYENGSPGYFLHVKKDPKNDTSSSIDGKDIDMIRDTIADEMPVIEKKRIIEKQRNKIVGRLDSAEKLLRTQEGQIFAGKEFESLLEIIYQLKKKIQMVNKISTSTKLYEDMIIREANVMNKKGFTKAANLLFSISQANNSLPFGINNSDKIGAPIVPTSPSPPQQGSGTVGGLPSVGPGMPQNPPESAPNDEAPNPKGINEFLENLDPGKKYEHLSDDILEVIDTLDVNDAENEILVTEAQEITPPITPSIQSKTIQTKKPIERTLDIKNDLEKKIDKKEVSSQTSDFDRIIDSVFADVTVNDIVNKLKDISKIYKTREIPRQLSIVDMMLDSKGLASYFPALSEAINKALESNNYIVTRLDDILAKLEGGIEGKYIDLKGENQIPSPEMDTLKQKLQNHDEKEKAKKKLRQQQADEELSQSVQPKETPEIDIEEDLRQPPSPPAEQIQTIK